MVDFPSPFELATLLVDPEYLPVPTLFSSDSDDQLVVTFSEAMNQSVAPVPGDFSVTTNDPAGMTVGSVIGWSSGTDLVLEMSKLFNSGYSYALDYLPTGARLVAISGKLCPDFSNESITIF